MGGVVKKAVNIGTGGLIDIEGQEKAIASAGRAQVAGQKASIAFQREFLEKNRADLAQAVAEGRVDLNTAFEAARQQLQPLAGTQALEQARNILADPSQVLEDPTVQFQMRQGEKGLENLLSRTTGGGLSSDAIRRAQEYGQTFASSQVGNALNRLMPFINLETQGAQNLANLEQGLGTSLANLGLGGASAKAGVTGQAIPGISQAYQNIGTIKGQQGIAQANVMPQTINMLANVARGVGSMASGFSTPGVG